MIVDAAGLDHRTLNEAVRAAVGAIRIENTLGQRFIGAGLGEGYELTVCGTPGNALGAYLDGAKITVLGNAQDAVGDTMNGGNITVHGCCGDTAGYAMRGGQIWIKGSAGYRAGIHMKEYREKVPLMVIGGSAGSFLGEYLAGGMIVVLGLDDPEHIAGNFCGTGMHGGKIFLRRVGEEPVFPPQVHAEYVGSDAIKPYIEQYCALFGADPETALGSEYILLTPNSSNPYKQLYVPN